MADGIGSWLFLHHLRTVLVLFKYAAVCVCACPRSTRHLWQRTKGEMETCTCRAWHLPTLHRGTANVAFLPARYVLHLGATLVGLGPAVRGDFHCQHITVLARRVHLRTVSCSSCWSVMDFSEEGCTQVLVKLNVCEHGIKLVSTVLSCTCTLIAAPDSLFDHIVCVAPCFHAVR